MVWWVIVAACAFSARPARAASELKAAIGWQGECEDEPALRAELAARGAELVDVEPTGATLQLHVAVHGGVGALTADLSLLAGGAREARQVEARDCVALRRAVAWVLATFAEERRAAELRAQPSAASFPPLSPSPAPVTAAKLPEPSLAPRTPRSSSPPAPAPTCSTPGPKFQLRSELLVAAGFVDALATGPALVGSYRPCARYLPGISLGASHLSSVGYELDSRAIRVERTAGHVGAWFSPTPGMRAELALELGRIRATGAPGVDGRGSAGAAPWLALVLPLRVALPVLKGVLAAQIGLDAVYTPLAYTLRYASGEPLARPSHFELRGAAGLAGYF